MPLDNPTPGVVPGTPASPTVATVPQAPQAKEPPPKAESPDNPGTADHWRGKFTNAADQPGFDPSKPTTYEDPFGEVSVTDTNDGPPGAPPAADGANGAPLPGDTPEPEKPFLVGKARDVAIQARQAGFTWDQINGAIDAKISTARAAGITDDQLNIALGWTGPANVDAFEKYVKPAVVDHFAANPSTPDPAKSDDDNVWDAFWNGITHSSGAVIAQTVLGQQDQLTVAKQYPDIFRSIAQGLGLMVAGQGEAASAGAIGGGISGGPIGAIAGFGVGLTADATVRAAAADRAVNGPATNVQDFGQRYVGAWMEGAKEAAPATAAAAIGGPIAVGVEKAGGGAILQWGSKMAGQVATMTVVAAGLNGRLPTGQEFVDNAISLGAFEIAGGGLKLGKDAVKAAVAPAAPPVAHVVPPDTVSKALDDLVGNFVTNGEHPADVVPRIARETSLDGLVQRDTAQNGKAANEADIRTAWAAQNLDDFSPATRARWYASARDDGVEIAGQLLKASGGDPATFSAYRGASLLKDFQADPKKYGGNLDTYLQRLDSRPPPAPEVAQAQAADRAVPVPEYVQKLSVTKPTAKWRANLADDMHSLTTNAKADDIQLRKVGDNLAPKLKPATPGYASLDEKFSAKDHAPNTVDLTPDEQKTYNETLGPLDALRDKLRAELGDTIDDLAGEGSDVTGGASPLPIFTRKDMTAMAASDSPKSALATRLSQIAKMSAAVRYKRMTESLKEDPVFKAHSVPVVDLKKSQDKINAANDKVTAAEETRVKAEQQIAKRQAKADKAQAKGQDALDHSVAAAKAFAEDAQKAAADQKVKAAKDSAAAKARITKAAATLKAAQAKAVGVLPGKSEAAALRVENARERLANAQDKADQVAEDAQKAQDDLAARSKDAKAKSDKAIADLKSKIGTKAGKADEAVQKAQDRHDEAKATVTQRQAEADAVLKAEKEKLGPNGEVIVPPSKYIKVDAPQFRDVYVDPRIGEVINDFLKGGPGFTNKQLAINKLAIGALFSLDPGGIIGHGRNLIETWLPARGWDNIMHPNPHFGQAMAEVNGLGPELVNVMRHGGSIISTGIGNDSLIVGTMKTMGQSMAKDPERWGPVMKAWGLNKVGDAANWWQNAVSHELYRFGDYLYMQRYLEYRGKGLSIDDAIKETELFMPTYRLPSRVMGSRFAAQLMGDLNVTAFGRYTIAKYRALGNAVQTFVSANASVEGRVAAAGRIFVATMLMTAGQSMMDHFMKSVTGNDNAEFLWGGPLGLVQKGVHAMVQPSWDNFSTLASTMYTPSPGWWETVQQVGGYDFFHQKNIVAPGSSPAGAFAERADHAIQGLNLAPPLDVMSKVPDYLSNPLGPLTDFAGYAGHQAGMSTPSDASQFFRAGGLSRTQMRNGYIQRSKDPAWVQFLAGG